MQIANKLYNGGVMANYRCNAACRHCLYASSPKRSSGYISEETAEKVGKQLFLSGCRSVHIGGGEPFLNFNGLITLIKTLNKNRVMIDYIETNAFWASDSERAKQYIKTLLSLGIDTLCISTDPFHAEYVAPELPLKLYKLCANNGMGSFLWKESFVKVLSKLDMSKTHKRVDFEKVLSNSYVLDIAEYYGVNYGGRALNIEEEYFEKMPLDAVLSSSPCRFSANHFHVDMYGKFIPPKCTGISIPLEDATTDISKGRYITLDALYESGVKGLYELAKNKGFTAEKEYTSSCALCFHIRYWLASNFNLPELDKEHYTASLSYYY